MKANKHVGEIIKKRRLELKFTRKHLSRLIGKSEISIKKYETGEIDIPYSVLKDICNALQLEIMFIRDYYNVEEES